MLKVTSLILILVFIFSGCAQKEIIKKVYIKAPTFEFQKINLSGAYIDLESNEQRNLCVKPLIELNDLYKGVLDFYDSQIDTYMKGTK